MLNFHDPAAAIDEPKTARMEQRTKPHVKAQIQQAAVLLGVDETTFVTSAALEQARLTIADHERTLLSAEDRDLDPHCPRCACGADRSVARGDGPARRAGGA